MEIFRLFRAEAKKDGTKLIALTVVSGVVNALLVTVIILAARYGSSAGGAGADAKPVYDYRENGGRTLVLLLLFGVCLLTFVLSQRYVLTKSADLAEQIVALIRIRIIDKIRRSNLLLFERVGRAELYTTLNESTLTLSSTAGMIATGVSSAFMLIVATGYIGYLSPVAFVMTVIAIAIGAFKYSASRATFKVELARSREEEKTFFGLLGHLLDGFKEVKMNNRRNDDLYENYLVRTARAAEEVKRESARHLAGLSIFGQTFFYGLLAAVIFILPSYNSADAPKISQIAAVVLFIMGPLGEIIAAVPAVVRANAAIQEIDRLDAALDAAVGSTAGVEPAPSTDLPDFSKIVLDGVEFTYADRKDERPADGESFRLGPLNVSIKRGEVLFIVGGNGGGKSTMLKVLTGLYPPASGSLRFSLSAAEDHGMEVYPHRLREYRSLFSVVFGDFHLFDRLYGLRDVPLAEVQGLVRRMRLEGVTSIDEERRFTTTDLSTGQRKRLALVVALLEKRPILVLDEFAADQDPHFRRFFYETLLTELREEGYTIIAATHDDHYFQHATRILRMEDGKLEDITGQIDRSWRFPAQT